MAQATGIEWTDASSNPLKYRDRATGRDVWACVKHSPGCAHCYSETLAERFGRGGPFTRAEMAKVEPYACEKELRRIATSKALAGKRVFVGDMTDLFGDWVSDALLDHLFAAMALNRAAAFQVLTKRADRMAGYFARLARSIAPLEAAAREIGFTFKFRALDGRECGLLPWPIPNVWVGTSAENQDAADARIPHLLRVPAAVRFLSVEPLLESVDLGEWLSPKTDCNKCLDDCRCSTGIGWVIVGGESGPGARPCRVEWVRSIVRQCEAAGVPVFVKQLGSLPVSGEGRRIGPRDREDFPRCWRCGHFDFGPCGDGTPLCNGCDAAWDRLRDKKGGDPAEWPADLRVREFPKSRSEGE